MTTEPWLEEVARALFEQEHAELRERFADLEDGDLRAYWFSASRAADADADERHWPINRLAKWFSGRPPKPWPLKKRRMK